MNDEDMIKLIRRTIEEGRTKKEDFIASLENYIKEIVYIALNDANIKRLECIICGRKYFVMGKSDDVCPNCKEFDAIRKSRGINNE
jgi:rubrerythrin